MTIIRHFLSLRFASALAVAIVFAFPLYFTVTSAFKPEAEIRKVPMTLVPKDFVGFDQFIRAFEVAPLATYLWNSSLLAVINVVVTVFCSAMAGYGFAKFRFPGRHALFLLVISTMMIPAQILVVPLFVEVKFFGWANSYAGLIVPGVMNALGVFMMRQFAYDIPDSLIEAARIDGASELRIFLSIVMPLLAPGLASLAIIIFLFTWGNFLWPLVVVQDRDLTVLATGMAVYLQPYRGQALWGPAMAGAVLATLPIALMFVFFQRYFVSGLTAGAVKG